MPVSAFASRSLRAATLARLRDVPACGTGLRAARHASRIAAALAATAAAALLALSAPGARAETLRIGGTGAGLGTVKALGDAYRAVDPAFSLIEARSLGTSGGLKALQEGSLDVAVIARPLTPDEVGRGLRAVEYGRTALVLATARRDVPALSRQDIAAIYAGTRTVWPDGTPIRLVLRPRTDTDVLLLQAMGPGIRAAVDAAMVREGLLVAVTDQDAADALERLPGGFGTSTLALIRSEGRALVPVAVDDVVPDLASIADGRYPWTKPMFLVTAGTPSPMAARYIAFVQSPAGRKLLAALGHVTRESPPMAAAAATAASAVRPTPQ